MFEASKVIGKIKILVDGKKTREKKIDKAKEKAGKTKEEEKGQSFGGIENKQV